MRKNEPVLVSDTVRITYQDFQKIRRKYRHQEVRLAPNCPPGLEKHREKIIEEGEVSTFERNLPDCPATYLFAFSNEWQISVMQEYSSILFLDSTHHTCYTIDNTTKPSFLYTLAVKVIEAFGVLVSVFEKVTQLDRNT
ncbi:hypothetical protein K3495_g6521 [Podosphaera aphanis]|nr:hypothetical protein K3495_g6521 [Podosphaera aphanis]